MECKVVSPFELRIRFLRINRNIVECKVHTRCPEPSPDAVLIETLWNVKITEVLEDGSSILY